MVFKNFHNAFPNKSEKEIQNFSKKFYSFFCDLILESIKIINISPFQLKKHIVFNTSIFEKYYCEKQSIIVTMGHFGNWELASPRFNIENFHTLYIIYHPLSKTYFDRLINYMRTRFGSKLYPMNNAFRNMISNRDKLTITVFLADQSPAPESAYWTIFLNQNTPFFKGPEKIARKLNLPVIYISVKRIKRGFYQINSEILIANPANTKENDILEAYTKRLEKDIIEQPECWLWTHKRWKHKHRNPEKN